VLIHGLYLHGLSLGLLAHRLRRAGYRTVLFSYPSLRNSVPASAQALAERVAALDTPRVHFVAHSLGGLIVRHLLISTAAVPPGRTVTLGTPHQGSRVARLLSGGKLKGLLGRGIEQALLDPPTAWPAGRELGSLAGTLNVGLGRLFSVPAPADGTVTVAETRSPGMTDHVCVPVSHTGLLFSARVAEQVRSFLDTGRFRHSPSARTSMT
jgi:pimeloyl-ACP methyl ester carboxylesterase